MRCRRKRFPRSSRSMVLMRFTSGETNRTWITKGSAIARPPIARCSPASIYSRIALLFKHFGVIDVMTAQSVAPRRTIMTTFTIDTDNNITAFPTQDHAEAAVGTGAQAFTSQKELAELAAAWPAERLVAIWNSLPGVTPVKRFKN